MRAFKRLPKNRGFTLVELMIVVAIIGVLAALAIYGVKRYLATSKTAEAKQNVGSIARAAQEAYERESANNQMIPEGGNGAQAIHQLCLSAIPVPQAGPPQNNKYQPNTLPQADFNNGTDNAGWPCLKFQINSPIYYQYNYNKDNGYLNPQISQAATPGFEAAAVGDLDGNGLNSFFGRGGSINPQTQELKLTSQVGIQNEYE